MKALILNSGIGKRMGDITKNHPKCMTELNEEETIISRQLKMLEEIGIKDIVITTGPFEDKLIDYVNNLNLDLNIKFINNDKFDSTNYIYSIYKAKDYLEDDIVLMHGDLVFSKDVLDDVIKSSDSVMTVTSTVPLPEKDFKAVIEEGKIKQVGVEFFHNALTAQPLYKLNKDDWMKWLNSINVFVDKGLTNVYAENALNLVTNFTNIKPFDIENRLCGEIDNLDDLENMKNKLNEEKQYGKTR